MEREVLEGLFRRGISIRGATLKVIEEQLVISFFERCMQEFNRVYAAYKENLAKFDIGNGAKPSKEGVAETMEDLKSASEGFFKII